MINMHDHQSHHIIHTPRTAPANRPNMVCESVQWDF